MLTPKTLQSIIYSSKGDHAWCCDGTLTLTTITRKLLPFRLPLSRIPGYSMVSR